MATYNQLKTEIDEVNGNLVRLRYCVSDIENNLKYHIPLTNFFKSGRSQLDATLYTYNILAAMYEESKEGLTELQKKYLETQLLGFSQIIDAFSNRLMPVEIDESILAAGEYTGIVTVVDDGDTIWVDDKVEVRMPGIDAPEKGTDMGQIKKAEMEELVLGKKVTVKIDPHTPLDMYQRVLGTVFLYDGSLDKFNGNVTKAIASTCGCTVSTEYGKNMYVDPEELKAIISKCKASFPGMGRVRIYGTPAKMTMLLDGEPTNLVTPKPLDITLGRHVIELRADNRATKVIEIDVTPGEQSYTISLAKLPQTTGWLNIESDVAGDVTIDGVEYGSTPMVIELDLGSHEVVIQRPNYPAYSQTVDVNTKNMVIVKPEK